MRNRKCKGLSGMLFGHKWKTISNSGSNSGTFLRFHEEKCDRCGLCRQSTYVYGKLSFRSYY